MIINYLDQKLYEKMTDWAQAYEDRPWDAPAASRMAIQKEVAEFALEWSKLESDKEKDNLLEQVCFIGHNVGIQMWISCVIDDIIQEFAKQDGARVFAKLRKMTKYPSCMRESIMVGLFETGQMVSEVLDYYTTILSQGALFLRSYVSFQELATLSAVVRNYVDESDSVECGRAIRESLTVFIDYCVEESRGASAAKIEELERMAESTAADTWLEENEDNG
ncbi:MAG: hypothetical protein WCL39_15865 [Armatimonadota bacterium]